MKSFDKVQDDNIIRYNYEKYFSQNDDGSQSIS